MSGMVLEAATRVRRNSGRTLATWTGWIAAGFGVLVASLPPYVSAGLLIAGVLGLLTVMTDAWITLYVAAFPLQGVSLFGVHAFGFRLSHVFFLVAVAVTICRIFLDDRTSLRRLRLFDFAVIAFVFLRAGSMAWSPAPLSRSGVAAFKLLFDLVVYFTLAVAIRGDLLGTMRRVAFGFGIAFIYMAGLTLYNLTKLGFATLVGRLVVEEALTGSAAIGDLSAAASPYTGEANRNIIASWEVLGLMLTWGVLAGRWRSLDRKERLFWIVALGAAICYIVLSLSRTAWLSLVVGAAVLWWSTGHRLGPRVAARILLVSAILVVGLWATGFLTVLTERVRAVASVAGDYGVSSRLEIWSAVLAQFLAHPVLGVGIQGTESLTRELTVNAIAGNPHNVYLQVLAELGLIGACVFGVLIGSMLGSVWRAGTALPSSTRRLAWGLFAALCCYLVQGMTQYDFMDLGIWTLLGLSSGMIRRGSQTTSSNGAGVDVGQ